MTAGPITVVAPSAMTHKGIRLSRDLIELPKRSVNIVHIKRPHAAVKEQPHKLLTRPSLQAMLDVQQPQEGISSLLSCVHSLTLKQQIARDLDLAVQLFSSTLQVKHLHAWLQIVSKQSCPKWHADFVQMRMLCTYAGPGTWCIENRFVDREYDASRDVFCVADVSEEQRVETAAGDLLFLKGQTYPGLYGAGAVHKSPKLSKGEERLLLTVDDGCC